MGVIMIAGMIHVLCYDHQSRRLTSYTIGTVAAGFGQHSIGDAVKSDYTVNQALLAKTRKVISRGGILLGSTDLTQVCRHLQFPTNLGSGRYKIIRSIPLQKDLSWQSLRRDVLEFDRTSRRLDHSSVLSGIVSMRCTRSDSMEH